MWEGGLAVSPAQRPGVEPLCVSFFFFRSLLCVFFLVFARSFFVCFGRFSFLVIFRERLALVCTDLSTHGVLGAGRLRFHLLNIRI